MPAIGEDFTDVVKCRPHCLHGLCYYTFLTLSEKVRVKERDREREAEREEDWGGASLGDAFPTDALQGQRNTDDSPAFGTRDN